MNEHSYRIKHLNEITILIRIFRISVHTAYISYEILNKPTTIEMNRFKRR